MKKLNKEWDEFEDETDPEDDYCLDPGFRDWNDYNNYMYR